MMPLFGRNRPPAAAEVVVPADPPIEDTRETAAMEHATRHKHALRLVHRTLVAERLKDHGMRNGELIDLCLDLLSTLDPQVPDAKVLREMPPVPLRYAVPVVPGGAS